MTASAGALAGLRVVEMGQLIAGPFCGQLLGDMGADVIKLEPPGAGDPMRGWGQGAAPRWWQVIARNKRSVSLDLRTADGQDIARRLLATADIVVENFRPGTLEAWGLAPAALLAANPRLIVVRVSGYGQTGPYAARAGFGGVAEAMGGWRAIVGDPDRPAARLGVSIGDTLAATYACLGALAALHHRSISGAGQVVDMALYEAVLQVMESLVPDFAASGHARVRTGAVLPGIAPSNVYRCRDGEYLIGANHDAVFARLCAAIGAPELANDARFAGHAARGRHQAELDAIIEEWTVARGVAEVEAAMLAAAVPSGRLYGPADMLADPHFAARGAIATVDHPTLGAVTMQNVFPLLSRTPGAIRTPAPATVGADNRAVLGDLLGLTTADLDALAARGVI